MCVCVCVWRQRHALSWVVIEFIWLVPKIKVEPVINEVAPIFANELWVGSHEYRLNGSILTYIHSHQLNTISRLITMLTIIYETNMYILIPMLIKQSWFVKFFIKFGNIHPRRLKKKKKDTLFAKKSYNRSMFHNASRSHMLHWILIFLLPTHGVRIEMVNNSS